MERYEPMDGLPVPAVICRDCSTRANVVAIPTDEKADHDAWHAEGPDVEGVAK